MRRSKKFILIALLTIVVLAGSIGGVVMADDNDDDIQPKARHEAMLDKVCDIYNANTDPDIDCEALKAAFAEAGPQLRPEALRNHPEMDPEAMLARLQALYDEGKITEEQFNRMTERMESMPDSFPGFGFRGHGGFRGFDGPCAPQE